MSNPHSRFSPTIHLNVIPSLSRFSSSCYSTGFPVVIPSHVLSPVLKLHISTPRALHYLSTCLNLQKLKSEAKCLVSNTHLGHKTRFLLLSDTCGFVDMVSPLWREDGSVVYNCCWTSPAQSFSDPSPAEFMHFF
jgi:hypothetical protein